MMVAFFWNLFKGCAAPATDDTALTESRQRHDEIHAERGRLEDQLKEAQKRLQSISREKDEISEKSQRLNVLLRGERQEKVEILAELARYKAAIATQIFDEKHVENDHALYLKKRQIKADVKQIMTVNAIEWAQEVFLKLDPKALPHLLARVFLECHALVEERRLEVHSFFLCGSNVHQDTATEMDLDTAKFMRRHMRLHFKNVFPVTGQQFEEAYVKVLNSLAGWMSESIDGLTSQGAIELLGGSGLRGIMEVYLNILVSAALQHPREEFTDDCGQEQAFDRNIHAHSIDGDHLNHGDTCLVVFPSLPAQEKYVLPALGH